MNGANKRGKPGAGKRVKHVIFFFLLIGLLSGGRYFSQSGITVKLSQNIIPPKRGLLPSTLRGVDFFILLI